MLPKFTLQFVHGKVVNLQADLRRYGLFTALQDSDLDHQTMPHMLDIWLPFEDVISIFVEWTIEANLLSPFILKEPWVEDLDYFAYFHFILLKLLNHSQQRADVSWIWPLVEGMVCTIHRYYHICCFRAVIRQATVLFPFVQYWCSQV